MKPVPECVPDALALALDAARQVSDDLFIQSKVVLRAMSELVEDGDLGQDASELTRRCLVAAYRALGVKDPYEREKARSNRAMAGLEKDFAAYCAAAPDPLAAALSLSLAGAMADLDVLGRAEAERAILERLEERPAVDDREALLAALRKAGTVLVLVDRAGEILLDKLLVREIAKRAAATVGVASRPILTMATAEDAKAVGLPEIATVVDPGAAMYGVTVERASSAFQALFASADVVIAKGETHFETLASADREVFYLLRAHCPCVARRLGVAVDAGAVVARRDGDASTMRRTMSAAVESGRSGG